MSTETTQEHDTTPGVMAWNELVTRDKGTSVDFYSKLFGWTTEDMELPGGNTYTMFKVGDRPVAGCVVPPGDEEAPQMWLSYVNVADIDESVKAAKSLGGAIVKERVDIPMGSFAIVADPQGGIFAFWQPSDDCAS
ncbi:VOC family protein [Rubellicoccus peritrichatus]|uniref:VOC family protein n=1 Tax=Rubellicoccus peritrichatus TaxID=3080537 RepID=A0AAQ3LDJ2_9BACT|nr:VOC family protein [Puniceicoccus sp. CR14]WOO43730.1 VOC family protein [Puniceicoccus sp. CR14]